MIAFSFACSVSSGIDLALLDPKGRERAAAVNNTYPGRMACKKRGLLQLHQKTRNCLCYLGVRFLLGLGSSFFLNLSFGAALLVLG